MALSRASMRSGALRHIVTIEQPPTTSDGSGGVSGAWISFLANEPAAIEPISGGEQFRADQTQFRRTHRVTVRYNPSKVPTTDMRVNFGGRLLYIVAVLNPDELNVWFELQCEERAQD
jgi:SPP1 family predicted phage head-tail adaptor